MSHTATGCIAPRCGAPCTTGSVFCDTHMRAPSGQRGGWISAHRRKQAMASRPPLTIGSVVSILTQALVYTDFSNVAPRLWVGAKPPVDLALPQFDVLVLCAAEFQPPRDKIAFEGSLLRCPIPDDALSSMEKQLVLSASLHAAKAVKLGRRVLVTCQQGINRSALVAALTLGRLTRMSAEELITTMRQKRNPNCLFNPHFRDLLQQVVGAGRQR